MVLREHTAFRYHGKVFSTLLGWLWKKGEAPLPFNTAHTGDYLGICLTSHPAEKIDENLVGCDVKNKWVLEAHRSPMPSFRCQLPKSMMCRDMNDNKSVCSHLACVPGKLAEVHLFDLNQHV
jgi:hypothetical protein